MFHKNNPIIRLVKASSSVVLIFAFALPVLSEEKQNSSSQSVDAFLLTDGVYRIENADYHFEHSSSGTYDYLAFDAGTAFSIQARFEESERFWIDKAISPGSKRSKSPEVALAKQSTEIRKWIEGDERKLLYQGEYVVKPETADKYKTIEFSIHFPKGLFPQAFTIRHVAGKSRRNRNGLWVEKTWLDGTEVLRTDIFQYVYIPSDSSSLALGEKSDGLPSIETIYSRDKLLAMDKRLQDILMEWFVAPKAEKLREELNGAEELLNYSRKRLREHGVMNANNISIDQFGRSRNNPGGVSGFARRVPKPSSGRWERSCHVLSWAPLQQESRGPR